MDNETPKQNTLKQRYMYMIKRILHVLSLIFRLVSQNVWSHRETLHITESFMRPTIRPLQSI